MSILTLNLIIFFDQPTGAVCAGFTSGSRVLVADTDTDINIFEKNTVNTCS